MSTQIVAKENAVQQTDWTPEQIDLITRTVAKGATPDELKLFLYRCKIMDLDPLKPGEVHFVKYGNNPGTMIVGRDGFRKRAGRTGKHTGTKCGVLRDDKGKCIGAWAEIYRADWAHPAREEVAMSEYNTGKSQWAKMPETMIKKVAEVAALRMAFPDELGGMYAPEEMDQADPHHNAPQVTGGSGKKTEPVKQVAPAEQKKAEAQAIEAEVVDAPALDALNEAREYRVGFGKFRGKRLGDIPLDELKSYMDYILNEANMKNGGTVSGLALQFMQQAEKLVGVDKEPEIEIPF